MTLFRMNDNFQNTQPTVLIVDDNPMNIQVTELILRPMNYKLIIATNGKNAINLLKQTKPDLILLDIMMPEMDGYDTCRIIKSDPENEHIPVIFLTALSDKTSIAKGFELGCADYIVKPFRNEELVARVKTHLNLKYSRDSYNRMAKEILELNSIKDKMFSVIGHDLRSPVGSLKMMIDLISEDPLISGNKEFAEVFDSLSKNAEDIYLLIENLLGWAKSQSINISIEPEEINLASVVNSNYLLYKENLEQKKIRFKQYVNEELKVVADMNMTKTVLRNLISNAVKFTPEDGIIEVSAKRINGSVQIMVKDNGIGISADILPKLLNGKEYYSSFGTNNEKGSGIGLDLCQRFIAKNKGKLKIESEPGKGSAFIIELPAVKK